MYESSSCRSATSSASRAASSPAAGPQPVEEVVGQQHGLLGMAGDELDDLRGGEVALRMRRQPVADVGDGEAPVGPQLPGQGEQIADGAAGLAGVEPAARTARGHLHRESRGADEHPEPAQALDPPFGAASGSAAVGRAVPRTQCRALVRSRAVSLVHQRLGRGAPLVLVHGIGGRGTVWAPILPALAARFEVLTVDLPGHGGDATAGGAPTSVEGHAARLERWFGELGLGRPHVAGSSMGGGIVLELARRGTVASATAISPIGFWTPRERTYARRSLKATRVLARSPAVLRAVDSAAVRRAALRQGFGRPERVPPAAVREILEALVASAAFDATLDEFERHAFGRGEELRGTPVTVAWGTRDLLLLHGRQAPRARRMLPWARHADLPGCGHLPFWDDPALCAAVVAAGAGGA